MFAEINTGIDHRRYFTFISAGVCHASRFCLLATACLATCSTNNQWQESGLSSLKKSHMKEIRCHLVSAIDASYVRFRLAIRYCFLAAVSALLLVGTQFGVAICTYPQYHNFQQLATFTQEGTRPGPAEWIWFHSASGNLFPYRLHPIFLKYDDVLQQLHRIGPLQFPLWLSRPGPHLYASISRCLCGLVAMWLTLIAVPIAGLLPTSRKRHLIPACSTDPFVSTVCCLIARHLPGLVLLSVIWGVAMSFVAFDRSQASRLAIDMYAMTWLEYCATSVVVGMYLCVAMKRKRQVLKSIPPVVVGGAVLCWCRHCGYDIAWETDRCPECGLTQGTPLSVGKTRPGSAASRRIVFGLLGITVVITLTVYDVAYRGGEGIDGLAEWAHRGATPEKSISNRWNYKLSTPIGTDLRFTVGQSTYIFHAGSDHGRPFGKLIELRAGSNSVVADDHAVGGNTCVLTGGTKDIEMPNGEIDRVSFWMTYPDLSKSPGDLCRKMMACAFQLKRDLPVTVLTRTQAYDNLVDDSGPER